MPWQIYSYLVRIYVWHASVYYYITICRCLDTQTDLELHCPHVSEGPTSRDTSLKVLRRPVCHFWIYFWTFKSLVKHLNTHHWVNIFLFLKKGVRLALDTPWLWVRILDLSNGNCKWGVYPAISRFVSGSTQANGPVISCITISLGVIFQYQ